MNRLHPVVRDHAKRLAHRLDGLVRADARALEAEVLIAIAVFVDQLVVDVVPE